MRNFLKSYKIYTHRNSEKLYEESYLKKKKTFARTFYKDLGDNEASNAHIMGYTPEALILQHRFRSRYTAYCTLEIYIRYYTRIFSTDFSVL